MALAMEAATVEDLGAEESEELPELVGWVEAKVAGRLAAEVKAAKVARGSSRLQIQKRIQLSWVPPPTSGSRRWLHVESRIRGSPLAAYTWRSIPTELRKTTRDQVRGRVSCGMRYVEF